MASANGKVILLGEHAVVYGVPALVVGIDRGATARVLPEEPAQLRINGARAPGTEPIEAFAALRRSLGVGESCVDAQLELPPGAGLGASAALGVAIARALVDDAGFGDASERVLSAADAWEKVFHGTPSGIDTTAAFYGGCFKFRRGHAPEFLSLERPLSLAIANTGPAASTKSMVEGVSRLRQRKPELVDKALEGIHSLVQNAALCLNADDRSGLGKLMDYNQMLLSGLFVSTPEIEQACSVAREAGAFGAKLTGAGGGGSVVALADDPQAIVQAWQRAGISGFVVTGTGHTTAGGPSIRETTPGRSK